MRSALGTMIALAIITGAHATPQTYSYVDWHSFTSNTISGTITTSSSTINVVYTGNYLSAQLNGGTNYWIPASTYTGSQVANAPGTPDIIKILGGSTALNHTLTFSQPVSGLVMDWVSLGTPALTASLTFDKTFSIVSQGPGFFGNGPLTQSGQTLQGAEGHGAILFNGTFSSLSWTDNVFENYHAFTVGVPSAVPEPASMAALGLGLCGLIARRRRKGV